MCCWRPLLMVNFAPRVQEWSYFYGKGWTVPVSSTTPRGIALSGIALTSNVLRFNFFIGIALRGIALTPNVLRLKML